MRVDAEPAVRDRRAVRLRRAHRRRRGRQQRRTSAPGDRVAVFGLGGVGLAALLGARAGRRGDDRRGRRRPREARARRGARRDARRPGRARTPSTRCARSPAAAPTSAIETVGSERVLAQAYAATRPRRDHGHRRPAAPRADARDPRGQPRRRGAHAARLLPRLVRARARPAALHRALQGGPAAGRPAADPPHRRSTRSTRASTASRAARPCGRPSSSDGLARALTAARGGSPRRRPARGQQPERGVQHEAHPRAAPRGQHLRRSAVDRRQPEPSRARAAPDPGTAERPGVLREAGLSALQVWQAFAEAQGRGRGDVDMAIAFTDLEDFSEFALGRATTRRSSCCATSAG